jgi:hypothetical protein
MCTAENRDNIHYRIWSGSIELRVNIWYFRTVFWGFFRLQNFTFRVGENFEQNLIHRKFLIRINWKINYQYFYIESYRKNGLNLQTLGIPKWWMPCRRNEHRRISTINVSVICHFGDQKLHCNYQMILTVLKLFRYYVY